MTADSSWVDAMPDTYDRCLGPALFAPFAPILAEAVASGAPARTLEIAAGTGLATRELVRVLPPDTVTATDLNPAMVEWAASRVGGAAWAQADAQSLPLADGSFDAVACQFGAMFFPDKVAAFADIARVLRPGGRLTLIVWDRVELSPFPLALIRSLQAVLPVDPPDFVARVPHGYHDAAQIAADLEAGGLTDVTVERVVLSGAAPSATALAEGFCLGTPLRFALEQRGDLLRLGDEVARAMTMRLGDGPVTGDLAAILLTATRA